MTEKNTVPKSSTSKSNYFCWTSLYDTIMCGEALKENNTGRKSFRSSVPYNSLYSEGEVAAVQCGEEAWAKVQEVGAEVQEEAGAKGQEEVGAEVKEEEWVEVQEEVGAEGLEEAGAECKEEEWVEVQEEVGVECKEEEWVEVQEEVWAEGLEEAGAECKKEEWVVVQDKAGVVAEWVAAGDVETAVLVVSCPRIPGCINCPFNNNCTRCNPPLSLLSTGQRAQCVRTCPFRFSRMNVNGSFVCQWRGSLEGCLDSMCSGCKNGYYYLEKDGRFCHKSCPKGYFVSYGRCLKCLKSCESCSTAIKCEKCKKGLFKVRMPSRPQSAICVLECPQGYKGIVVNETSEQICQKVCHVTHCQSCESDSYHGQRHCDVCSPGYIKHKIYAKLGFGVIYDDECRKECPKGYQVEMNKLGGTECVKQIVKRPGPVGRDNRKIEGVKKIEQEVQGGVGIEQEVQGGVGTIEQEVQGGVGTIEQEVQGGVETIEQEVQGGVGTIEQEVQGRVGTIEQEVQGEVGTIEQEVQGGVRTIEQEVQGEVVTIEQEVQGGVGTIEQEVQGEVKTMEQEVQGVVGTIEQEVQGGVGTIEQEVQGGVGTIEQEVQGGVGTIEQEVQGGQVHTFVLDTLTSRDSLAINRGNLYI
ncbi:predicted protein [Nematostella vectensis]|uniref:Uncharacterized protein n=1 Tax=Nematostella vectensis TaxID=45351 RepID=A7T122_NEMVE|nr:predicted protein [Nematostella vectensis]|eukprot:XP_001622442.1 hypothetical protein NEMVEDRAFT_v1g220701 [Nematostella vectensis]